MKPSDFQKTVQCRFESCLKKVVRSVVKDYYKELNRRKNKEISFSELPDVLVDKMAVWDDYETDYTIFSVQIMNNTDVPIWEKYTLTVEEASKYFRIGEKKLRKLAEENIDAGWVIVNGNRIQIKRKQFEKIIDTLDEI